MTLGFSYLIWFHDGLKYEVGYIKKLETWEDYFGHPKFKNSYFLGYKSKNFKILRIDYILKFPMQKESLKSEVYSPFESLAVKSKMQFGIIRFLLRIPNLDQSLYQDMRKSIKTNVRVSLKPLHANFLSFHELSLPSFALDFYWQCLDATTTTTYFAVLTVHTT